MTVHELQTIPPFFQDVLEGRKTFELRKDDRGFSEGDELWLREWVTGRGFTGRSIRKRIVYMIGHDEVLPPSITGLVDGHVILGLAPVAWRSAGVYGDDAPRVVDPDAAPNDYEIDGGT